MGDGWTLKKYKYKDIPIYRYIISDRINENITNGISLAHLFWFKQDPNPHNNLNPSTHIIMANSLEEKEFFESTTEYNVVLGNHNAFINENVFIIEEDTIKKYDLVINSAFNLYKRRYLAKKITNTVHIGYYQGKNNVEDPINGIYANFENNIISDATYKYLNKRDIVHIYNISRIGGIFSEVEGACYSSSEYLLCGIPVLSTYSKGGRDIFYNETNSIVCNATERDVKQSFDCMIENIDKYDKYKIRNDHIEKMDEIRNNVTSYVKDLIEDKFKETVDFNELKSVLKHYRAGA